MHFTPQQLSGGANFHHKCRIGNWSEDCCLTEDKIKDYQRRKESGTLLADQIAKRLRLCNLPVTSLAIYNTSPPADNIADILTAKPLSGLDEAKHSARWDGQKDGCVYDSEEGGLGCGEKCVGGSGYVVGKDVVEFGDALRMVNGLNGGCLAVDPYDTITKPDGQACFTVTTSPALEPRARNVFVIERDNQRTERSCGGFPWPAEYNTLHYGQPFKLKTHPTLQPQSQTYICAEAISHATASKHTHHQEIFAAPNPARSTSLWKVLQDTYIHILTHGQPPRTVATAHITTSTSLHMTTS
eukprot:GHVQ01025302.1.p1 GENE.GHVQ01025302.1~~GHVQ01025302.1.p1  ORF type:complete len:299 (+),score=41.83 GHVQ01025302.1:170-1066(+)